MYKRILLSTLALGMAALACGLPAKVPTKQPGADVTDSISISRPEIETAHLKLEFGAGKLTLAPGESNLLAEGSATYNIPDIQPKIVAQGDEITIQQGDYKVDGWPNMEGMKNEWDLKLGKAPLSLTIQAGAYTGNFDLGGLSLVNLSVNDGASDVKIDFSQPNLTNMNLFKYKTGASNVKLYNLANANFTNLVFEGGAGNYTLDFNGTLQRDAAVNIGAGVSNVTLIIPKTLSVQLTLEGGLSSIDAPEEWKKNGDTYTQAGEGPTLTILLNLGAGNLQIIR